jgi:serine/threonine protein phosphatase PrpC
MFFCFGIFFVYVFLCHVCFVADEAKGFLLVGSDGFWDAFADRSLLMDRLLSLRGEGLSAEEVCAAVVAAARASIPASESKADDATVLLVDLAERYADHCKQKKVQRDLMQDFSETTQEK